MSGSSGRTRARERVARRLLERLDEQSPDLREVAIFDADGEQLLASDGGDWTARARALWAAVDSEHEGGTQLHVGTDAGEVFAVRDGKAAIVATAARFPLASLMLCDLRAVLRQLEGKLRVTPKPHRFLIERVSGYADEAGAFLRRRRLRGRSFARIWVGSDRIEAPDPESPGGERILAAAADLLAPRDT